MTRGELERFWAKVAKDDGCWLWTGSTSRGYGYFSIGGRLRSAHRVSWSLEHGPIPAGLYVLHRCDVRACVRPAHLFLGTQVDNMRDCVAKGRHAFGDRSGARTHPHRVPRGERNGHAKLTEDAVRAIRAAYASGVSQSVIAREARIDQSAVSLIVTGRRWKHVQGGAP